MSIDGEVVAVETGTQERCRQNANQ